MPKLPFEPIAVLHLFPRYQTREDYESKIGQPCPPWDPNRRPKEWLDPNPIELFIGPDGSGFTVYDRVLTGRPDATGVPGLTRLVISIAEASSVNIPPKGTGATNVPGADQPEVYIPLKPLSATQALVYRFGATVAVRNLDVPLEGEGGGFSLADRDLLTRINGLLVEISGGQLREQALLKAIAEKVGVA